MEELFCSQLNVNNSSGQFKIKKLQNEVFFSWLFIGVDSWPWFFLTISNNYISFLYNYSIHEIAIKIMLKLKYVTVLNSC